MTDPARLTTKRSATSDADTSTTATTAADELRRRVERLQRQRGRRRRHPAIGARIGAAGFSLATMFGLVAAMGLSRTSTDAQAAAAATAAPNRVVVVLHRSTATTAAGSERVTTSGRTGVSGPITLAARPAVRPAAQSPSTPAARTHGSR
jgi:hypothetical protein